MSAKIWSILIVLLASIFTVQAQQDEYWFYLRANDTLFEPTFIKNDKKLIYTGTDSQLSEIFRAYSISRFKKTKKKAKKKYLNSTFFVVADRPDFLDDVLKLQHLFTSGEIIPEADMKIFEPNDYGSTSTIGDNLGLSFNLDYLDVMEVPKAWYYTTGSKEVAVGISDGAVDTTRLDFKGKTTVLQTSGLAKGHGYSMSANAAAQGNNGYGIPGVCYDCVIYASKYGDFRTFKYVLELAQAGAKVINCSWVGGKTDTGQAVIDQVFDMGSIIVAGAGNKGWNEYKGTRFYYPASYKNVISVSSVQHRYEHHTENINYQRSNGKPFVSSIRGYVGRTAGFKDDDITNTPRIYDISTGTLNSEVDILAPSVGLFRYSKFILNGVEEGTLYETTSGPTALVTGSIALLFSLNPCLPHDEVESIIKMTAINIDGIEANKRFKGMYGAGIINTGEAVEMVHQLYNPFETAYIENQDFSRWDFKITSLSKKVVIQNQKFTDRSTLKLTAKNQIVIGANTHLKPNRDGGMVLRIDSTLQKQCDLRYRDPSVIAQQ